MIQFKAHNLIGLADLRAMTAAITRMQTAPNQPLPLEILDELRCLGIQVVYPFDGGGVSIPHHGTVA